MIQIEHVSFGYPEQTDTLHDVTLLVPPGECILLCGESGCGKTTITKLINGLIPRFAQNCRLTGTVHACGLSVADSKLYELAKEIGSVFQNPKSQFFNLDTDSELAFGLENEGMPPKQMAERIDTVIGQLGIGRLMNRNIFTLSGGEKQTLAFASVYAMAPAVYVLDEPTANLDEKAVSRLREQISVLKKQGHTVVIAEHRLYFLRGLIDRAAYIRDGHLVRTFTGEEFWSISEEERIRMGLRSLKEVRPVLPVQKTLSDEGAWEAGVSWPVSAGAGLAVEGLSCGYKKQALVVESLSFSVRSGEVLAVTGANGIGKTTLTRCLCGLLKERSGRILLDGKALKAKARQRESFLVMQDVNHQLFYDSVWNECEQAAGGDTENIEKVLEQFDLLAFRDRHPMALSGGQKQRLAVATALLSKKRVLIFDEPTSGLDYRHMVSVCDVVRSLAQQGHIVLVVSHDGEFIEKACDRVLELSTGRKDGRI